MSVRDLLTLTPYGGLPMESPRQAAGHLLTFYPDAPAWPRTQGPRPQAAIVADFLPLPGLVKTGRGVRLDRDADDPLLLAALEQALDRGPYHPDFSFPQYVPHLDALAEGLSGLSGPVRMVKLQVPGMASLLSLPDRRGRPLRHFPQVTATLFDFLAACLRRLLKPLRESRTPVWLQAEEPLLTAKHVDELLREDTIRFYRSLAALADCPLGLSLHGLGKLPPLLKRVEQVGVFSFLVLDPHQYAGGEDTPDVLVNWLVSGVGRHAVLNVVDPLLMEQGHDPEAVEQVLNLLTALVFHLDSAFKAMERVLLCTGPEVGSMAVARAELAAIQGMGVRNDLLRMVSLE